MSWSTPVDLYCERTDPSLWAEPVNALTNAAFLLAAAAALVEWRRNGARDLPALALIGVMVLVGLGSFAFHTLATSGAALLDVIPIALFVYGYLLLALRRFLRLAPLPAFALLAAFIAASRALSWALPPGFLNNSGEYLPALAAMLAIGWAVRDEASGKAILRASGVFIASLALRTMDNAICPLVPLGTHFLWHVLNAVVLTMLLSAAIAARGPAHAERVVPAKAGTGGP